MCGESGDCVVITHIGRFISFISFLWILSILSMKRFANVVNINFGKLILGVFYFFYLFCKVF